MINSFTYKLKERATLRSILLNIGWLFFDKVFRVGCNFFITVLIARYLGAEQFGLWNYAIAFVALFSIFSTLGLDSIVVKELVKNEESKNQILGASFFLKLAGGIIGLLLSIISILFVRQGDYVVFSLVLITAGSFLFQSFDNIDFYFQSKLQSKYTVYARNGAFSLSAIIKLSLLYYKAPLISFALATLLELFLTAIFLTWIYVIQEESIRRWKVRMDLVKKLLQDSLPLLFAGAVILIYMRTDQIMLGNMIGDREVGVFSAAVRLSEAWYFIPLVITNSILPAIIKAKEANNADYLIKIQKSFDVMAWLGTLTAVAITFLSPFIIQLLYGPEYADAAPILAIHTWTSIFVFLGFASGNWFVVENLQKLVFFRTLAGAVVNVMLNYLLIPVYGGMGAAIATLVSQFVASYFFNLFHPKTLPIFKMQTFALGKVMLIYYLFKFASGYKSRARLR